MARRTAHWEFDPVVLGRQECDAWAAYYRHEWAAFLRAVVGMVATGFGMTRRDTVAGAWHVLRANQAWAPYPDNDPDSARAGMRRFYALVASYGHHHIDPDHASMLEVDWWRVHRAHQHDPGVTFDELLDTLNALYTYVYDADPSLTRPASALRVEAMDLSDQWVENGCDRHDPVLAQERLALVASYTTLREATARRSGAG